MTFRETFHNYSPSPDYSMRAKYHTRKNDSIHTNPGMSTYNYILSVNMFGNIVNIMICSYQADIWCYPTMRANNYFCFFALPITARCLEYIYIIYIKFYIRIGNNCVRINRPRYMTIRSPYS